VIIVLKFFVVSSHVHKIKASSMYQRRK